MDSDSEGDLAELEERLYSQVHHEASWENPNDYKEAQPADQGDAAAFPAVSVYAARTLSNRYWAKPSPGNDRYHLNNNIPSGAGHNNSKNRENARRSTTASPAVATATQPNSAKTSGGQRSPPAVDTNHSEGLSKLPPTPPPPVINTRGENRQTGKENNNKVVRNPFAAPNKRKPATIGKNNNNNNHNAKPTATGNEWATRPGGTLAYMFREDEFELRPRRPKKKESAGPFARSQVKLEKAKRIREKRDKSKAVRAKNMAVARVIDTIVLQSSSESGDDDDVIEIAVPPPPILTITDSDDDDEGEESEPDTSATAASTKVDQVVHHEENAMTAEDSAFAKPSSARLDDSATATVADKATTVSDSVPSSRCISPVSVMSSDDFIGQLDRSRLAAAVAAQQADDQELQALAADIDSMLGEIGGAGDDVGVGDNNNKDDDDEEEEEPPARSPPPAANAPAKPPSEPADDEVVCTHFVVPSSRKSYRVDEGFGRALDVYESESDLTESVYSKGAAKPTVIRSIAGSSDDDDDADGANIGQVPYTTEGKTKRLRKRRASSNRGSDLNTGGDSSSDEDGEQGGTSDGVHPTTFPFIAQGVALEKHKSKMAKVSERRTTGSDDEFIASLNNLVQNAYEKHRDTSDEDSDEDAGGRVAVTARDIAATVLEQSAAKAKPKAAAATTTKTTPTTTTKTDDRRKTKEPAAKQKATSSKATPASASITTVALLSSESEEEPPFVLSEELRKAVVESDALLRENREGLEEGTWPPNQRRAVQSPCPESLWPLVKQPGQVGGLGWIEEMRRFYECSWHGENFSLGDELRRMSREKSLWRIQPEDRMSRPRNSRVKCHNCLVFGHTRAKCRQPKKAIVCYMCGCSGHSDARCPYTVCLRCGNKTNVFTASCNLCSSRSYMTCAVCKLKGHVANQCPDLWRRYHSTTTHSYASEGGGDQPNSEVLYKNRKFCSSCGKRGHLYESCRSAARFARFAVTSAHIHSHSGVYQAQEENPYQGIPVNLLYDPDDCNYGFRMTANVKSRSCYGRFLRAVGLQRQTTPEKRRRRHSQAENAAPTATEMGAGEKAEGVPRRKKAKRTKANTAGEVASGSDSEDVVEVPQYIPTIDLDRSADDDSFTPDTFKTPAVGPRGTAHDPPLPIDSDSNYSFSEHFDVPAAITPETLLDDQPSTSKAAAAAFARASAVATSTPTKTPRSSNVASDTPDFIPLTSSGDKKDRDPLTASKPGGISQRYVAHVSDDEDGYDGEEPEDKAPPAGDKEQACDAKVILSTENSAYLLSPAGRTFLNDVADSCSIRARLDFTSVGYVLFIHGRPADQDRFHQQLLQKYDQLAEARHREYSANVPKRIDALVRFLRDSIGQLLSNCGCVQELMRRVSKLERMRSKNSLKQADRARRSLNMILVGQTGLLDGSVHLDKLLEILRKLLDDYTDGDAGVPEELRTEILAHWRLIFTAYRHDNYTEMAQRYKVMRAANQLPKLSIDPKLLGRHVVDVSLSSEQKERLDRAAASGAPPTANPKTPATKGGAKESPAPPPPPPPKDESAAVAEDISLHVVTPQKGNGGKHKPNTQTTPASCATTSSSATTTTIVATTTTTSTGGRRRLLPSQVATSTLDWHCDSILEGEYELTAPTHGGLRSRMQDGQAPSMFWSRECLKYIEHSKEYMHNQPRIREKLQHVEQRAKEGLLSYHNYRTIIKLHNCLKGRPSGDASGGSGQRAG